MLLQFQFHDRELAARNDPGDSFFFFNHNRLNFDPVPKKKQPGAQPGSGPGGPASSLDESLMYRRVRDVDDGSGTQKRTEIAQRCAHLLENEQNASRAASGCNHSEAQKLIPVSFWVLVSRLFVSVSFWALVSRLFGR